MISEVLTVLAVCGLLALSLALRWIGVFFRQKVFGRRRARELGDAFPEWHFQQLASHEEIVGFSDFSSLYGQFSFSLREIFRGGRPEISNLVTGWQGEVVFSVFDLRTLTSSTMGQGSGSHTGTAFVLHKPGPALVGFELSRESFAHANLWGEDPDIDIEDEFIFSQNFYLTGPDRVRIRQLFDSELVSYLRQHTLFFASGRVIVNNSSLIFQHGAKLGAEEIRTSLAVVVELMEMTSARSRSPDGDTGADSEPS